MSQLVRDSILQDARGLLVLVLWVSVPVCSGNVAYGAGSLQLHALPKTLRLGCSYQSN